MESCANCKHKEIPGYCYPCCRCDARSEYAAVEKAVEIRTNGDRIRAMSDEELAKHFSGMICDINEGVEYHENPNRWLEWLKQPAEEAKSDD